MFSLSEDTQKNSHPHKFISIYNDKKEKLGEDEFNAYLPTLIKTHCECLKLYETRSEYAKNIKYSLAKLNSDEFELYFYLVIEPGFFVFPPGVSSEELSITYRFLRSAAEAKTPDEFMMHYHEFKRASLDLNANAVSFIDDGMKTKYYNQLRDKKIIRDRNKLISDLSGYLQDINVQYLLEIVDILFSKIAEDQDNSKNMKDVIIAVILNRSNKNTANEFATLFWVTQENQNEWSDSIVAEFLIRKPDFLKNLNFDDGVFKYQAFSWVKQEANSDNKVEKLLHFSRLLELNSEQQGWLFEHYVFEKGMHILDCCNFNKLLEYLRNRFLQLSEKDRVKYVEEIFRISGYDINNSAELSWFLAVFCCQLKYENAIRYGEFDLDDLTRLRADDSGFPTRFGRCLKWVLCHGEGLPSQSLGWHINKTPRGDSFTTTSRLQTSLLSYVTTKMQVTFFHIRKEALSEVNRTKFTAGK